MTYEQMLINAIGERNKHIAEQADRISDIAKERKRWGKEDLVSLAIRDLEQQAKGLSEYAESVRKKERLFHINLKERMTIHDSCRNQAEDLRNQAKALKEQGE